LGLKQDSMNIRVKPLVALASGAMLLSGLFSHTAQAQSTLIEQGTSSLGDVFLVNTGSEALTVSWFVVENTSSDLYTYAFNVNNPSGDVQLNNDNTPYISPITKTTVPETFNSFSLTFDTTIPGAFVSGTQPVGGSLVNNGSTGLTWNFPAVSPGSSTALLAFQSDLAPGLGSAAGNASAGGGATPPSPWSSIPAGQPVPVPRAAPEPEITGLLALTALVLLPFSSTWRRLLRQSWDSKL
jgi:hypothetical protein